MKRLVSIILNFMIKNNVISKDTEEIEFYRYGIEITLSSLINIAFISIIGIVTNYSFESTMFLAVFMSRADGRLIWITVPCWITRRCLHGWGYPSLYRRSGRSSVPW